MIDNTTDALAMPGPRSGGERTRILVVGGGAGGLQLVRKLGARFGRDRHDIVLIERNRTHVWKPLLHEIAAGTLDASLDEVGYAGHGAHWGYRYFRGALESIDRQDQTITTAPLLGEAGEIVLDRQRIRYDWLVLAIGGVSNDFGTPGVQEHAMFLETRAQADLFRHRLLDACFRVNVAVATGQDDARVRVRIVGGGATGVELAAELRNAAMGLVNHGLDVFDPARLEISVIEAGPRILGPLDEELAATARESLRDLGVRVLEATPIVRVERDALETKSGERLPADLILWAAGVRGAEQVARMSDLELNKMNQFVVGPTLQTTRDPRIFAIGDCAAYTPAGQMRPVPPRAQTAHQMADLVFENLVRVQEGREPEHFQYRDHGSLVSLSRFSAVGTLMGNLIGGRMAVEGRLARLAYNSLYRMHLLAIHGWLRGTVRIITQRLARVARPRLKLH